MTKAAKGQRKKKPAAVETPLRVRGAIKIRGWSVVCQAVESSVAYGVGRAFKHTDRPTQEEIIEEVEMAVMSALSDVLDFGDGSS